MRNNSTFLSFALLSFVAGPKLTTLISIGAVVVLYNNGQDSVLRVAGPKPTMLISTTTTTISFICMTITKYYSIAKAT